MWSSCSWQTASGPDPLCFWHPCAPSGSIRSTSASVWPVESASREGTCWASAAAEAWWCFTGQAPTCWTVLAFLPGAANCFWLRRDGASGLMSCRGGGCSQCLCWFEAMAPWCNQFLWKTLRGLCASGCRNQWRVGAWGSQDLHQLPRAVTLWTDSAGRGFCPLACAGYFASILSTCVAPQVILLDVASGVRGSVRCSFPFIWRASSSKLGFFFWLDGRLFDLSPLVVCCVFLPCVQLRGPVLWQVFFLLQRRFFPAREQDL